MLVSYIYLALIHIHVAHDAWKDAHTHTLDNNKEKSICQL